MPPFNPTLPKQKGTNKPKLSRSTSINNQTIKIEQKTFRSRNKSVKITTIITNKKEKIESFVP